MYKGFQIEQRYDLRYYGIDPEADYDCDSEGYHQCSGMDTQQGASVAEVKQAIDEYLADED